MDEPEPFQESKYTLDPKLGELMRRIHALTGRDPFSYATTLTPTTTRYVFQNRVCLNRREAIAYATDLLAEATMRGSAG